MTSPRLVQRLVVVSIGIFAALVALELGLRVLSTFGAEYLDSIVDRPPPAAGRDLRLGEIIRPHPSDRIVYELRPGLSGRFLGKHLATNSLGMRSPERPIAKPPGTFRIVGVGDSVMFGWGVAEDETYLSILDRELAARFPDRRFEVWNLAVPGYNAVQEVETFAANADRLDPDLVVIGWIGNDVDLPNFLADRPRPWALDKSFLAELVAARWRAGRGLTPESPGLFEVADDETQRHRMKSEEIPPRYRQLVGWENMNGAYRRLAELAKERHIPAVVVFAGGPRHFKKLCSAEGFLVVEGQHRVIRYEQEHGVDRYTALQISRSDPHPNAIGHQLIAQALLDGVATSGALAKRTDDAR